MAARKKASVFLPQNVSNLVWAFADLVLKDEPLLSTMAHAAVDCIHEFDPQALASTAWAFAKLFVYNGPLVDAIVLQTISKINQFRAQELSNLLWSMATMAETDGPLVASISLHVALQIASFGSQELANTAWACAILLLRDAPVLESIASQVVFQAASFSPQNLTNTAWAFATLRLANDPLLAALSTIAAGTLSEFGPQDLANFAWACATLGFEELPLMAGIAEAAMSRASEFSAQNLANTAWAFASLLLLDLPLVDAIATAATMHLRCEPDVFISLTGIVWAFHFVDLPDEGFYSQVRSFLRASGRQLDANNTGNWHPAVAEGHSASSAPKIVVDLPDRFVLFKPPGWEVDTTDAGRGKHLSEFVQDLGCPIFRDSEHGFGLLHRLDTPSSGLILTAKSFEAFYDLKLQLNTGAIIRDYLVLCHGWLWTAYEEINARVLHWRPEGNLPSRVARTGRPSVTFVKTLGHFYIADGKLSLVTIRIRTGRRHQIRTHLAFVGHPTVCDGKYAETEIFNKHPQWCPPQLPASLRPSILRL